MARLTMALLTMSYSLTTHLAHEEGSALGHDGEVELVQVLACLGVGAGLGLALGVGVG